MNIEIDTTVSYEVKNVKVRSLGLGADRVGKLVLQAPYEWYDENGKLLRSGINRYTQDQLVAAFIAKGEDFTPIANLLLSFVPITNDKRDNCHINIADDGVLTASKSVYSGTKWNNVSINAAQFEAAISPMTTDQLKTLIAQFTLAVFE